MIVTIATFTAKCYRYFSYYLAACFAASSSILGSSNSLGHLEAMLQIKKIDMENLKKVYTQGNNRRNPVVHFEMPAEDRKRMADFYTKVFGWKTQQLGEDMGNYILAATTDSDERGPKKPGQ